VLHCVREESREEKVRYLSNPPKSGGDIVAVSAPCKLLICMNIVVCLG
jgi:hypothetical protein